MARAATAAAAQPGAAGSNYPVIRDKAAVAAAADYALKLATIKKLEAENKLHKETLLNAMGDAPTAMFGGHIVTQTPVATIAPTPNRVIDKSMIGQVIPGSTGRKGYTQIKVQ